MSERQVDRYVAAQRRLMGEVEAFVPLVSDAGVEAEVDWDEGYDNLKAAVVRVMKGRRRVESDRFVALRSHYMFESSFCQSGERGAHEKGGVEGEVGRFRRHLVPVPRVGSLAELNELLQDACFQDLQRTIIGRPEPVGEMLSAERRVLNNPPREAHCTAQEATPRVDSKALVTVRQNRYSVPARLAGFKVRAQIGAREIVLSHDGKVVASHERLSGKHGTSAQLDHYLDLLAHKPGALAHSLALRQERDRGDWSGCFDELWSAIQERCGRDEAARQMVDVLMLCRELPPGRVESSRPVERSPQARTTVRQSRCSRADQSAPHHRCRRSRSAWPGSAARHRRTSPTMTTSGSMASSDERLPLPDRRVRGPGTRGGARWPRAAARSCPALDNFHPEWNYTITPQR